MLAPMREKPSSVTIFNLLWFGLKLESLGVQMRPLPTKSFVAVLVPQKPQHSPQSVPALGLRAALRPSAFFPAIGEKLFIVA